MPSYEYHALDAQGDLVRGQIEAADDAAARLTLRSDGLRVMALFLRAADEPEGRFTNEEVATFVDAVGGAAASRLPVEITLAALAEETKDRQLAGAAGLMAIQLEQGATIEQVISNLGRQVPTEVANLLRAGVESGDLAGTMERLAQQRMATQRIQRRIQLAVAYPLIIMIILVPLLLFLSLYVIPMFADMYKEFDMAMAGITELILQTSLQVPMLIGGVLVLVLAIPFVLRVAGGRWLFHRVRSAVPLVGPLWTWSGQREFAAQLASFLKLRLPLTDAVTYTGDALSDRNVGHACRRVAERLESGESLGDCLSQSIHFDRSLVALVSWGEEYGLLPEALRVATDVFDDQIEQYSSLLRRLLPPITLVVVAALMFFIIVGLMVPLVNLIKMLSM